MGFVRAVDCLPRTVDLFVIRSAYCQPFGTFTGTLPGGLVVERGYGVMEDHRALW